MPNKPIKAGRGRPRKSIKKVRASFAISPEMRDKLDKLKRLNQKSQSAIIEALLQECEDDFKVKGVEKDLGN
ncbi:MAG: ribbon-helix-helix protein, CopG family [Patescibacteria group bacterium]